MQLYKVVKEQLTICEIIIYVILFRLAGKLKLLSKCYSDGPMKYLIVSKPLDIKEKVQELLRSENYETEKYRLIHPLFLTK